MKHSLAPGGWVNLGRLAIAAGAGLLVAYLADDGWKKQGLQPGGVWPALCALLIFAPTYAALGWFVK